MLQAAGCAKIPEIQVETGPLFCDVEEQRRFSQDEIDWRAEHAAWNLARDLKTNETGARECGWGSEKSS